MSTWLEQYGSRRACDLIRILCAAKFRSTTTLPVTSTQQPEAFAFNELNFALFVACATIIFAVSIVGFCCQCRKRSRRRQQRRRARQLNTSIVEETIMYTRDNPRRSTRINDEILSIA